MSLQSALYDDARKYMVGGVSAGGRYHRSFGQPLLINRADGSKVYDVDGKEYIDYHTCAGAVLFGYNHPRLKKAPEKAMDMGFFINFETFICYKMFVRIVRSHQKRTLIR